MTLCHFELFQHDWAERNGYTLPTTLIEVVVYRVWATRCRRRYLSSSLFFCYNFPGPIESEQLRERA
jgi:hypothetical protein